MLSLFPGIGLLDMAFEENGFIVVRGPDPLWGGDIRRFHPPAGKFAGLIGGPPCQVFSSLAHLVRANGYEPKFGNLIPDFERCVVEAGPEWFVMENVPAAPVPTVPGYGVKSFLLDNSGLAGEGGFGLEQRRVRRFSFGMRWRVNDDVPSLLRWIDLAVFLLPDATGTVSQPDNSKEAKVRRRCVTKAGEETPVRIGGSGLLKPGCEPQIAAQKRRQPAVTSTDGGERPSERRRVKAVSSSNGGNGGGENGRITPGAGNQGKGRYRFADACRLQGLPEDFLVDAPFTADGKIKAVANGVPLPMGRAIAKAVKEAITCCREAVLS